MLANPMDLPHAELLISRAGLVDIDLTFFVHLALYLGLIVVLNKLIFAPMLQRIEQRDDRTSGAFDKARGLDAEADAMVERYEVAVSEQKRKALETRAEARTSASAQAASMIDEARGQTNARIDEGIKALREDAKKAREALRTEAGALSEQIASKLVPGGEA